MVCNPTLDTSYQVNKVLKNFDGGQVITYEACKVIEQGLLFMYGCDTFLEAKAWIEAERDRG